MSTKCRQSTRACTRKARANKCRSFAHEGHAQAPHALAGEHSRRLAVSANTSRLANTQTKTRCAQAGAEYAQTGRTWSASTRARHRTCRLRCTLAELANREMRLTTMVEYDPNERTGGMMSRLVAEELEGVLKLARRAPVLCARGCRSCWLVPSPIDYAC